MRFLLVHGGLHGAWCWDRLIPELNALGHEAVAVDLPGHGARRNESATMEGYRDAVTSRMGVADVLVGHSMGGFVVTLAADARPRSVTHVVYLAAGVPCEGLTMSEAAGGNRRAATGDDITSGSIDQYIEYGPDRASFIIPTLEAAIACFYHDCDAATARWAFERLTPQPLAPVTTPIFVPNFWDANLPRSFIRCADDRALDAGQAQSFIERLNVAPLAINASHSPFLSKPCETAELIVRAVATKPLGAARANHC